MGYISRNHALSNFSRLLFVGMYATRDDMMIYGPHKREISMADYVNIWIGRTIGKIYRLLFEWWLDVPMARRAQERFAQEIREALPFLFAECGGQIVPNEGIRFPPGGGYSYVTIAIEHLLLRFCRGRGEFRVHVASRLDLTRDRSDWKDVELELSVLDRSEESESSTSISSFRTAGRVLQAELSSLLEATSEGQWDLVKRKVNARFPPSA